MGPCNWPLVTPSDCPAEDTDPGGLDAPVDPADPEGDTYRDVLNATAIELLWRWTGSVYGTCPVEVRPCREDCSRRSGWSTTMLLAGAAVGPVGHVVGGWCGTCGPTDCGCTYLPAVVLPGPVASIDEVVVDGQVLDPAAYRLDAGNRLVRLDGGSWPACQDMAVGPDDEGAFTVRYQYGIPVPSGGQVAAGVLACELAQGFVGGPCQLPERVQTLTRQGVTMTLLDSFDDIDKGRTGLWSVDSWVSSIINSPRRSTVWSPDVRRTTVTPLGG